MDVVTDMTHINGTTNTSTDAAELSPLQCLPQMVIPQHQLNISGLFFLIIPAITVLGNSMVIIAVLRFKTLHSAINFLIFGLAVADLLVGLFVMPYAVYVHVQGGYWFLGSMMCDIYSASDVACSTASILILTVISFDRYRAVTHPISYSHKSHDTRRVIFIMIAIWVISLALASPIVLGVNIRPSDADPYECRFYNPIFSISSSMISFVIPCFIVLFVYIRIMIALRQRQKLSKAQHCSYSRPPKRLTKEAMTAVSSFDYSGQKAVTEIVETTEMARRQSAIDCDTNGLNFGKEKKKKLTGDTLATISKVNIFFSRKTERGNSKNGVRKLSKELDSCGICLNKNMNYDAEMIKISDANILNTEQINSKAKKSFSEELVAQMLQGLHYNSLPCPCRQATLNRLLKNDSKSKDSSAIFVPQPEIYKFCELQSESISANRQNENAYNVSKDTAFPEGFSLEAQPELSAEFVAQELSDNKPVEEKGSEKKKYDDRKRTESKIVEKIQWRGTKVLDREVRDSEALDKIPKRTLIKSRVLSSLRRKCTRRKLSPLNSSDSAKNNSMVERKALMLRRPLNRSNSLSGRHSNKSQRIEKRATKTLGIVVGIFLACWVPFFSVYILSAICIQLDIKSCQAEFYALFYTTWLGYINSCVNPIIYTIFNVEFRRAFKCILLGKFSIRKGF